MEQDIAILKDKIADAGLKITVQRLMVLKAVFTIGFHPTAEQVYDVVRQNNPTISLATVYKNLESMVNAGLLKRVWCEDGHKRFDAREEDHAHIHCTNTKEIVDFHDEELNNMIINYFKSKRVNNLKIKNISLHISGEKIDPEKPINIK